MTTTAPRARHRRGLAAQRRIWRAQWPLAVVLTAALAGLGVVALGHVAVGAALIAAAVLLGAVLRLLLSERAAGLLAVRNRALDVATLGLLGGGLLLLTLVAHLAR